MSRASGPARSGASIAPHPRRAVVGRWIGIGIFHTLYRGRRLARRAGAARPGR